jgi:hypothetical protein
MNTDPNHFPLSRRKSIALLVGVAVAGLLLVALNLGLYDTWVVKPREEAEARKVSAEFAETQKISEFERRLDEELNDEDEEMVVARLGQPDEKRNVDSISDGKTRPLWRYKNPPISVSFCDGRVQHVRVESLKDFPRELLDSVPSSAGQTRAERNLYPLKPGNKWEYTFCEVTEPETKVEIVTEVTGCDTKEGRITATLSAAAPGEKAKEEKVISDERGVYRNGVSGLTSDREFPIIKYPIKIGDTWIEKVRINGFEIEMTFVVGDAREVKVPAGRFRAIPITTTGIVNGKNKRTTKWFVDGIGVVKEKTTLGVQAYRMELRKFTSGK